MKIFPFFNLFYPLGSYGIAFSKQGKAGLVAINYWLMLPAGIISLKSRMNLLMRSMDIALSLQLTSCSAVMTFLQNPLASAKDKPNALLFAWSS